MNVVAALGTVGSRAFKGEKSSKPCEGRDSHEGVWLKTRGIVEMVDQVGMGHEDR